MLAHATTRRERHDQRLTETTSRLQQAHDQLAALEHGPGRFLRRGDLARAREQAKQAEEAAKVARQQADRAADRERQARQAQQQHQAHREAHPDLLAEYQAVREDKWRGRAEARAVELERPGWSRDLGERPTSVKGGRAWDRAVGQTVEYRQRWKVTDGERALGPDLHGKDVPFEERRARRHAERAIGRLRDLTGDRAGRGDQREATSRGDYRDDHEHETGRGDHRGERRRPLDRERDHDRERAM